MSEHGQGAPIPEPENIAVLLGAERMERCFGAPADRMEFLRSMDAEEFHRVLAWTNRKVSGLPPHAEVYAHPRKMVSVEKPDGQPRYFGVLGWRRTEMLDRALGIAQTLDDPEQAGALLATMIVGARPFEVGNDLTARMAHDMLARGFSGTPEDEAHYAKILEHPQATTMLNAVERAAMNRRFSTAYTRWICDNAGIPHTEQPTTVTFTGKNLHGIQALPDGDVRKDMYDLAREPGFNRPMLTEFILRSGRQLTDFIVRNEHGNPYLDAMKLIQTLRPEDGSMVWDVFGRVKEAYLQSIMNCFQGDTQVYGSCSTLVDSFRRSVDEAESLGGGGGSSAGGIYEGPQMQFHDPSTQLLYDINTTLRPNDREG